MDIEIYSRGADYYFDYQKPEFKALIDQLAETAEDEARGTILADAQSMLSDDSVNAFLFQLAKHGVWDAKIEGLWENSPVQANDLTKVRWTK